MPEYAATATHPATAPVAAHASSLPVTAAGLLITALVIVTLGYTFVCWIRPFRTCRRCHGTGERKNWIGSGHHYCRTCDGTGHALRTGRRGANYLRDTHNAATPTHQTTQHAAQHAALPNSRRENGAPRP